MRASEHKLRWERRPRDISSRGAAAIFLLGLGLLLLPNVAAARVIAVLKDSSVAAYTAPVQSFERGIDARVVVYDLGGDLEKGREIAQQLARVPPDLVLALGAKSAYSARKYIATVPVVYALVINPEKYQLDQPNITGITLEILPETTFTQYRMFAPNISRVGVIYSAATEALVDRAEVALKKLDITLVKSRVSDSGEVPDAFRTITGSIDSLWMLPDSVALTPETFKLLLTQTLSRKLPYLAFSENFVRAGALVSVSPDYAAIGSQAASIARQILDEKQSPSSLPPAAPIGTHLTVNQETATKLGLKIDPLILVFADEVIGQSTPGATGP